MDPKPFFEQLLNIFKSFKNLPIDFDECAVGYIDGEPKSIFDNDEEIERYDEKMTYDEQTKFKSERYDRQTQINQIFVSGAIQHKISTTEWNCNMYGFKIDKLNVTVKIFRKDGKCLNKLSKSNEVDKNKLMMMIYTLYSLRETCPLTQLIVRIFDIDDKKLFRDDEKSIKMKSINSGYTEKSYGKSEITIFRSEEIARVLIHELIHAFHFDDVLIMNNDKIMNYLHKKIKFASENADAMDIACEHFVEFYAEIILAFMAAWREMGTSIDIDTLINMMRSKYIYPDMNATIKKISRVLKNGTGRDKIFRQSSNFINYFYIRYILLLYFYLLNIIYPIIPTSVDDYINFLDGNFDKAIKHMNTSILSIDDSTGDGGMKFTEICLCD